MKNLILKVYDYFSVNKNKAIALLITIALLAGVVIFRSNFSEDIAAFLPHNERTEKYYEAYKHLADNKIIVFFRAKDGGEIRDAMEAFAEESIAEGIKISGRGEDSDAGIDDIIGFIGENAPLLMTEEDIARADSLLNDAGYMPSKLSEVKKGLYGVMSSVSSNYYRHDPLGLFLPVVERLKSLNPIKQGYYEDGFLFSDDGELGAAFLELPSFSTKTSESRGLLERINTIKNTVLRDFPDVEIISTGAPEVAVANADCIRTDALRSLVLAILIIITLLWLALRRVSYVVWIFITILFGVLFALGIYASFNSATSLIIVGMCTVVMGLAANYPIHLVDHLKFKSDRRRALSEQINPLLVGNITTVGAFLSLLLLSSRAMREFGLIGAITLVCTIFFVLIFLPVFLPVNENPLGRNNLISFQGIKIGNKAKSALVLIFTILTAFFFWKSLDVSFDTDISHINYMTDEQKEGFETMASFLNNGKEESTIYIVSTGNTVEEALQAEEGLGVDSLGRAIKISSLAPSIRNQQKRILKWQEFKSKHQDLITNLQKTSEKEGFKQDAFEPFFATLNRDFQPQELPHFSKLISLVGEQFIFAEKEKAFILSRLEVDGAELIKTQDHILSLLPKTAFAFSEKDLSAHLIGGLSDDFNNLGFICAVIVFFFLWLCFSRLEVALLAFLPIAIGWLWILGMMSILGIKFNIVNFILATFIFGQGDDYTIFVIEGLIYEYATGKKILASYKSAIALSAIIMFIAIGVLILSRHPALRSLAELTMIGMVMVVVMAWLVPPVVFEALLKIKRYYLQKRLSKLQGSGAKAYAKVVRLEYLYKGHEAALECRKVLCKKTFETIDNLPPGPVEINNAGYGVYALLLALSRKDISVTACEPDEDKYLTASRNSLEPENLRWRNSEFDYL